MPQDKPPCQATFTNLCQFPKCDCDRVPTKPYITQSSQLPVLAQCHDCRSYIVAGEGVRHYDTWFHVKCFSRYAHYYGLDKPID